MYSVIEIYVDITILIVIGGNTVTVHDCFRVCNCFHRPVSSPVFTAVLSALAQSTVGSDVDCCHSAMVNDFTLNTAVHWREKYGSNQWCHLLKINQ